jgi:riboflavin biosynthesis pyrimidine reductase
MVPTFHRLAPEGEALAHELLAEVRPRERAPAGRPFTYLNFVTSLDGRATIGGGTSELGEAADLEMLLELRMLADAVLIGTGTLRAEGYDRIVRAEARRARRAAAGLAEDPLAVLLTRRGDVPWEAGLFRSPDQPVLVYSGEPVDVPDLPAPVEIVVLPDATPAAALADLRERGVRALLCEGGPVLARALVEDRLVDELFLTLAPLLTGEAIAPRLLEGGLLGEPVRLRPLWVLRAGDELFLRYGL